MKKKEVRKKMRVYHRYLGFFLAGIMGIYALSGIVLIFRDTDFFKNTHEIHAVLSADTTPENLGEALKIRRFKIDRTEGDLVYFKQGTYNLATHEADYTKKEYPYLIDKMAHLHKSTSSAPLAFLNIFFGVALLFFVLSSFWMFAPGSTLFKKGIYYTLAGVVFAGALIFI